MKNKKLNTIVATAIISMCTATSIFAANSIECPSANAIQSATFTNEMPGNIFMYSLPGNTSGVGVMLPSSIQNPTRAQARQFLNKATGSWTPTAQPIPGTAGYVCAYKPGTSISNPSLASGMIIWVPMPPSSVQMAVAEIAAHQ